MRSSVIRPGMFGSAVAADTRRWEFDLSNEALMVSGVHPDVVFIGDSITHFWELQAYFSGSGKVIINRGIGGDTSEFARKRFAADVLQLKPELVVIMIGTNDLGWIIEQLDESTSEKVLSNINSMINDAQAAGCRVAVGSIIPVCGPMSYPVPEFFTKKNAQIVELNTAIKACADESGAIYVDYHSKLLDDKGWLRSELADDGVHPHSSGYAIMAEVLRGALAENGIII